MKTGNTEYRASVKKRWNGDDHERLAEVLMEDKLEVKVSYSQDSLVEGQQV